jgi:ribosome-binding protein aMBF1 (putative translation factor)
MKAFDAGHPRCIFPLYGAIVDAAMRAKNLSATDVARHLKIDPSGPAGYRRGFGRNDAHRTAALEALLGVKLFMGEPVPSAKAARAKRAADDMDVEGQDLRQPEPTDPVIAHLTAIALLHGLKATFASI